MRFKLKIVLHGKSLRIRLKEHGSVGIWSEVNYDSTRFDMQSDFKYNRPQKPGWTGGDDGKRIYKLTPLQRGFAIFSIDHIYRGKIVDKYFYITITI